MYIILLFYCIHCILGGIAIWVDSRAVCCQKWNQPSWERHLTYNLELCEFYIIVYFVLILVYFDLILFFFFSTKNMLYLLMFYLTLKLTAFVLQLFSNINHNKNIINTRIKQFYNYKQHGANKHTTDVCLDHIDVSNTAVELTSLYVFTFLFSSSFRYL